MWVVRVEEDDKELRPWYYMHLNNVESRLKGYESGAPVLGVGGRGVGLKV
jgi:hypothetical protein